MTTKDFYKVATGIMQMATTIEFGDFDIYCRFGSGATVMITHQLNGADWDKCCSTRSEWNKKLILLFPAGFDSKPNDEPIKLGEINED